MHAPSECTPYWKEFLTELLSDNPDDKRLMANDLGMLGDQYQRPMVVKNLSLSLAIEEIIDIIPNARFIHVERDLSDVAGSIARVRTSLGVNDAEWWSIRPSNYEEIKDLPVKERIEAQVKSIDQEIKSKLEVIPQDQIVHINYPLEVSPSELVHKLARQFALEERNKKQ